MPRKPKIESNDCQGGDAEWHWRDREAGIVTFLRPSNGKRGSLHVPDTLVDVEAYTTDDYLWLFECPFCGYADSDPIEPEED